MRGRSRSLSPWGNGPEPADHDFMRRLFDNWDASHDGSLTLQNVVTGMASIKGNKDIMANIAYFFELFDDDKDGKVDREGILRISEALLFLSRRGIVGMYAPPMTPVPGQDGESARENRDEMFLSSISSFIRRCFEYADPDHPANKSQAEAEKAAGKNETPTKPSRTDTVESTTTGLGDFSIGDDDDEEEEEDLMDMKSPTKDTDAASPSTPKSKSTPSIDAIETTPSKNASHNVALDPANPLSITLPTFRMLILADELLESFFETAFGRSFRLADDPAPNSLSSIPSLTTFQNPRAGSGALSPGSAVGAPPGSAGGNAGILPGGVTGGAAIGVVPPNRGIRGMLDTIVSDGMRVAAEVRRRMDEAAAEIDRAAGIDHPGEEDDEDDEIGGKRRDTDARSIREDDRDLLEGAETEAVHDGPAPAEEVKGDLLDVSDGVGADGSRPRRGSVASGKSERILEFEGQ
jgi:TBC1 domain family member 8/9